MVVPPQMTTFAEAIRDEVLRNAAYAVWKASNLIRVATTPEGLRDALLTIETTCRALRIMLDTWEARQKGGNDVEGS